MKIYVIIRDSWNGERDVSRVEDFAFFDIEKAREFCKSMNSKRRGSYDDNYDFEEVTVK